MSTWDLNGFQAVYDCHVGKISNDCNLSKAEAGSTLHEVQSIVLLVWAEHYCENNINVGLTWVHHPMYFP